MSRSLASAVLIALVVLVVLPRPATADRLVKGRSLVEIGVSGYRAQLAGPAVVVPRDERGEVGVHAAYYRFLSDHWTFGLAGGYHLAQEKLESGAGTGTLKAHSYSLRVGGDRFAFIDDDVALYAGPGVIYSRGSEKVEATGTGTTEGPDATEVGLNGRIGMYARLRKGVALFGHIGQVLSRSSAEDAGVKRSWWSSTHEGSVGLAFDF